MKKIIYILIVLFSITAFSQEAAKNTGNELQITNISVFPNPFNVKTTISFNSSYKTNITFTVRNLLGSIIKSEKITLLKGKNSIPFYQNKLNSGIYIYSIKAKDKVISKRFVVK